MTHILESKGSYCDAFVLEPMWNTCFYPRDNSVYSRNRKLVDSIKEGKFTEVQNSIKSSTSSDLKDPLLLRNILAAAFYQKQSSTRNEFISYMLSLEPIIYLTKMFPSDTSFRNSNGIGMVAYQSIITEAASRNDSEIMQLIKDRFGIELIVSSNIIEKAIDANNSQMIRAILGMDPRFTPDEIESIASLRREALAEFLDLRNQKSCLFSRIAFLPTYAMYTAKNLSNTACAAIAVTGAALAYATYRYRANL